MDVVSVSLKLATLGVAAYGITVLGRDFRMGMGNMGQNLGEGVGKGIHGGLKGVGEGIYGGLKAVGEGMRDVGSGSADGYAEGSLSDGLSKGLAEGISGLGPGLQTGLQGGIKGAGEALVQSLANLGRKVLDVILGTQFQQKRAERKAKIEIKNLEEALAAGVPEIDNGMDQRLTMEQRQAMERALVALRDLETSNTSRSGEAKRLQLLHFVCFVLTIQAAFYVGSWL